MMKKVAAAAAVKIAVKRKMESWIRTIRRNSVR
jgi:hypothetical protein